MHAHNGSGFYTWIILNNLPWISILLILLKMEKASLN